VTDSAPQDEASKMTSAETGVLSIVDTVGPENLDGISTSMMKAFAPNTGLHGLSSIGAALGPKTATTSPRRGCAERLRSFPTSARRCRCYRRDSPHHPTCRQLFHVGAFGYQQTAPSLVSQHLSVHQKQGPGA
jgi:hypothetical protein